jgi:hypothetical protein
LVLGFSSRRMPRGSSRSFGAGARPGWNSPRGKCRSAPPWAAAPGRLGSGFCFAAMPFGSTLIRSAGARWLGVSPRGGCHAGPPVPSVRVHVRAGIHLAAGATRLFRHLPCGCTSEQGVASRVRRSGPPRASAPGRLGSGFHFAAVAARVFPSLRCGLHLRFDFSSRSACSIVLPLERCTVEASFTVGPRRPDRPFVSAPGRFGSRRFLAAAAASFGSLPRRRGALARSFCSWQAFQVCSSPRCGCASVRSVSGEHHSRRPFASAPGRSGSEFLLVAKPVGSARLLGTGAPESGFSSKHAVARREKRPPARSAPQRRTD